MHGGATHQLLTHPPSIAWRCYSPATNPPPCNAWGSYSLATDPPPSAARRCYSPATNPAPLHPAGGIFQVMIMGRSHEEASQVVAPYKPYVPFRDPSSGVSTFHLTVFDVIKV